MTSQFNLSQEQD